jgi:hypothetical protein
LTTPLLREQLGLGYVSTMEVSPDGRTVYFGRCHSYEHDRMNLGVISLDANGQPIGDIMYFRDCTDPLQAQEKPAQGPISDGTSSVIKIVLDTSRPTKKLYLAVMANGIRSLAGDNERSHLSIYDLDQNGIPITASLVSFLSPIVQPDNENIRTLMSFAVNNNKAYFVGVQPAAVYVWSLADTGQYAGQPINPNTGLPVDSTGQPVTSYSIDGVSYLYDIAINPNANPNLLYLGSMLATTSNPPALLVVKLNANGDPDPASIHSSDLHNPYIFGTIDSSDRNNSILQFRYAPGMPAIYRRRTSVRDNFGSYPAEQWHITAWPLRPDGKPIDTINEPYSTKPNTTNPYDDPYLGFAESIDTQTNKIWIATVNHFTDVFNSNITCTSGVTVAQYSLDSHTCLPTGSPIQTVLSKDRQYGMLLANAPSQLPVLLTQVKSSGNSFDWSFIGNTIRDIWMQFTIQTDKPPSNNNFPVEIEIMPSPRTAFPSLPPLISGPSGQFTSDFYSLNQYLKADASYWGTLVPWIYVFRMAVMGITDYTDYFDNLIVTVNLFKNETKPTSDTPIWTSIPPITVKGNTVLFVIPSYNFLDQSDVLPHNDPSYDYRKTQIRSYDSYLAGFGNTQANCLPVQPGERPKQFIISSYSMSGLQGSVSQLQTEAETLAKLGINTVMTAPDPAGQPVWYDQEWPEINVSQLEKVLDNAGLIWRQAATHPPAAYYFDFYLQNNITQLNNFVNKCVNILMSSYNGSPEKLVNFHLADEGEVSWRYPDVFSSIPSSPSGQLTVFQQYLSNLPQVVQGTYTYSDFVEGATSWSDNRIVPTGGSAINQSVKTRRLFFWTIRFFAESASKGFAMARDALNNALDIANNGSPVQTNMYANWQVHHPQGFWYHAQNSLPPSPPSDTASGWMDWFQSGRLNANTLWTEDEDFLGMQAQLWSFLGDGLRCAGMLAPNYGNSPPEPGGPGEFGGYIMGKYLAGNLTLGGHPAAATYKILALIGHGAKTICIYNYGPYPISNIENSWSEFQKVYQPIADAIRLVGHAEKLLFPGRPRRGNVAIYIPGISHLWDITSDGVLYQNEIQFIHYALIHTGYTVDFVDDYDLASGALQQRAYTTLYVTGPNVANDRNMIRQPHNSPTIPSPQEQIQKWVEQEGILAVTPGGGVVDEYNCQTSIFDTILGLDSRTAVVARKTIYGIFDANSPNQNFNKIDKMTITDFRFGDTSGYFYSLDISTLWIFLFQRMNYTFQQQMPLPYQLRHFLMEVLQ